VQGTKTVRVLLADDHRLLCDGLQMLLNRERDMEVVGIAADGRQALTMARKLRPDVVVMDVAMPELNGIQATSQILAELPSTRVVALSMYADRRSVHGMLSAGATGYLLKDCAAEELAGAIRQAMRGRVFLSAEVASLVVGAFTSKGDSSVPLPDSHLSAREKEVLQLLAEGYSAVNIAATLNISRKTVETHRRHIMDKLGINSVAELTKYAVREGISSLE